LAWRRVESGQRLVDLMSALDIDERGEAELRSEIDDLSSYLRGIPAELRESGAFTPYEVRLQQLLETLLTERMKQALHRYHATIDEGSLTDAQRATYEEIQQWLTSAERRHQELAHDYLRMVTLLNGLISATANSTEARPNSR